MPRAGERRSHRVTPTLVVVALLLVGVFWLPVASGLIGPQDYGPALTTVADDDPLPPVDSIVQQFRAMAFRFEGSGPLPIFKWRGPVRIYAHEVPPGQDAPYRRSLAAAIAELSDLSGLDIRLVPSRAAANLHVVFMPRNRHLPYLMRIVGMGLARSAFFTRGLCWFVRYHDESDGHFLIERAYIGIGTDIPQHVIEECILEELSQALGPMRDACHYRPSLFCDLDAVTAFTAADRLILRTYYDPRIRPGATERTAMPAVHATIQDLSGALGGTGKN